MLNRVLVIAEAGVNHNGSLDLARQLVDAAVNAGADVVKFQTFRADQLATADAPKADYQVAAGPTGESQLDMLRSLELSPDDHRSLVQHCAERGIEFLSTAFDDDSMGLLGELGMRRMKVPSGEVTNLPYLESIGKMGLPVLLSTGMADLAEVEAAIDVLVRAGTRRNAITVLHCTSAYPAPVAEVNLRAMVTLREALGVAVGYSDHTQGTVVSVAAVALGATVIEKHLTLDCSLPGPDHRASLEPTAFTQLVEQIRATEAALGDGEKRCMPSEASTRTVARRSIVARHPLPAGHVLTADDLAVKRPGTGLSPMMWHQVIGRTTTRSYRHDEALEW